MNFNFIKQKKIFITGGAGFIGKHLVKKLIDLDCKVTVVDKKKCPSIFKKLNQKLFSYYCLNLVKTEKFNFSNNKFNIVFHLASLAYPKYNEKDIKNSYIYNIYLLKKILDYCIKINVDKIIFPSAGALYYYKPDVLPLNEKMKIFPNQSNYAFTKRIGELVLEEYYQTFNLRYGIIRLFNTYGPYQDKIYIVQDLIIKSKKSKILKILNGNIIRDFVYVGDAVNAFILISSNKINYMKPINISNGKGVKILKLAEIIANNFGKKVLDLQENVFGPKKHYSSNKLAKKILNWNPLVNLKDGINKTINNDL